MTTPSAVPTEEASVRDARAQVTIPEIRERPVYMLAKQSIDAALSLIGVVLLLPLFAVVVVAIRLDSPGPAIFRQERIGRHGRRFTMLKFRSMRADADERVHRESVRRTALGIRTPLADGREVFKSPDDPRVTRVGRIIRPTCIDELPQLLNVLRGEMSLVGPRPALAYELPFYKSWHFARFDVLPGITGLWQVTRTTDTSFDDMMRLDIEYAASSTVLHDLQLMLLTIPSIIRDRGVF